MGKFLQALYDQLSLYVRQHAWLNTEPERAPNDKRDTPLLSRLEKMRKEHKDGDDFEPEMPEVDAEYLLAYLFEMGPTMSAGGYPSRLTCEEIQAWQNLSGVELEPWESRFLRRLSGEYLLEGFRARKADCPEPAFELSRSVATDARSVAERLRQTLKAMAGL